MRQPTAADTTSPTTAKRTHITRISGEIRNCTTISPARSNPSRHGVLAWRTTIAYSEARSNGGTGSTETDTCPNSNEVTRAAEYP